MAGTKEMETPNNNTKSKFWNTWAARLVFFVVFGPLLVTLLDLDNSSGNDFNFLNFGKVEIIIWIVLSLFVVINAWIVYGKFKRNEIPTLEFSLKKEVSLKYGGSIIMLLSLIATVIIMGAVWVVSTSSLLTAISGAFVIIFCTLASFRFNQKFMIGFREPDSALSEEARSYKIQNMKTRIYITMIIQIVMLGAIGFYFWQLITQNVLSF